MEWHLLTLRPMAARRRKFLLTSCLGLAWIFGVAFGIRVVLNYDTAAGAVGTVPVHWPAKSAIQLAPDRMTLVMFAHPRCPCTRATMGELAKIMAEAQGKLSGHVVFYWPNDSAAGWDDTDLRRSAAAIPGVTVSDDVDGVESHRFGAETSGHTLLFDRGGRLLFSGGITDSRGHAGGNNGESAVLALVSNQTTNQTRTLVFGCRITGEIKKAEGAICSR